MACHDKPPAHSPRPALAFDARQRLGRSSRNDDFPGQLCRLHRRRLHRHLCRRNRFCHIEHLRLKPRPRQSPRRRRRSQSRIQRQFARPLDHRLVRRPALAHDLRNLRNRRRRGRNIHQRQNQGRRQHQARRLQTSGHRLGRAPMPGRQRHQNRRREPGHRRRRWLGHRHRFRHHQRHLQQRQPGRRRQFRHDDLARRRRPAVAQLHPLPIRGLVHLFGRSRRRRGLHQRRRSNHVSRHDCRPGVHDKRFMAGRIHLCPGQRIDQQRARPPPPGHARPGRRCHPDGGGAQPMDQRPPFARPLLHRCDTRPRA